MSTPNREQDLIEKIRSLPPDKLSEVEDFVDFLRERGADRRLTRVVTRLSEDAFSGVWGSSEDADYDRL